MEKVYKQKQLDVGVYLITNINSGRSYVGSSSWSIRGRWLKHRWRLKKNTHHSIKIQRAFNKYGMDVFVFKVLEYCEPVCCVEREQVWMDILKPFYNTAQLAESTRGCALSDKHRAKLRRAWADPERKEGISGVRRALWEDPDYRYKVTKAVSESRGAATEKFKVWINNPKNKGPWRIKMLAGIRKPEVVAKKVVTGRKTFSKHGKRMIEAARRRHIKDYKFISPVGLIVGGETINGFAAANGLDTSALNRVVHGQQCQHKGWRFAGIGGGEVY